MPPIDDDCCLATLDTDALAITSVACAMCRTSNGWVTQLGEGVASIEQVCSAWILVADVPCFAWLNGTTTVDAASIASVDVRLDAWPPCASEG